MELLPDDEGIKFSFLITKLKPKPKLEATETAMPSTPGPKVVPAQTIGHDPTPNPNATPIGAPTPGTPGNNLNTSAGTPQATPSAPPASTPAQTQNQTPQQAHALPPPPRIEDFDEAKDIKEIDFYQPVTFTILTDNEDILQSLPRSVRTPDVVVNYMNEIFDMHERPSETSLAFRLPKEESGVATSAAATAAATPVPDVVMGGTVERKKAIPKPRRSLVG